MKDAYAARAKIELAMDSPKQAEAARLALQPEQDVPFSETCRIRVERTKNVLCLQIEAKDTATLRAVVNSSGRWVMVAKNVTKGGK